MDGDFGLVTCSSCGAQVMIELGGGVASVPPLPTLSPELSQSSEVPHSSGVPLPSAPPVSSDMSEIADYGNSQLSQGREGMLRFNVFISGIDSADVRRELLEALTDEKFLWNAEEMIEGTRNGDLKIEDLTAVKASILIQRLRSLSVEIRWEQYAIHQA